MTKGGSKYLKIKVNTETGEVVKKVDENENPATSVTQADVDQIYQNQGFKHVGTILHAESNPGCAYLIIAGWGFKICW